jgi:hypothetical protein
MLLISHYVIVSSTSAGRVRDAMSGVNAYRVERLEFHAEALHCPAARTCRGVALGVASVGGSSMRVLGHACPSRPVAVEGRGINTKSRTILRWTGLPAFTFSSFVAN